MIEKQNGGISHIFRANGLIMRTIQVLRKIKLKIGADPSKLGLFSFECGCHRTAPDP